MSNDDLCPECGEKTEREEIDVGPGNVYLPRSCPVCHWSEEDVLKTVVPKFGQSAPIPNDKPALWPMVIEDFRNGYMQGAEMSFEGFRNLVSKIVDDMHARDQFGRDKYGVPLQAGNSRDPLKDSYEELLDAAVYLKQTIEELDINAFANGQFTSAFCKHQKQIAVETYRKTLDSIYAIKKLIEERR